MFNVLLFYSVYVMGFMGGLFKNPIYGFMLYEAVYFFNPQDRWWGYKVPDISYSFFVVVLMMAMFAIKYSEFKQNRIFSVPQFRWMYFVLFLYLIANFYAVWSDVHLIYSMYFLKLVLIVSVAYKICDTSERLDYMMFAYIFGAWYIGVVAFQLGRNSGDRVEGIGMVDAPNANDTAAAIVPAVVLCLYYFWRLKPWWGKALIAFAGIFIANGLILINSRGAFLGVALSIVYFMLFMYFSSFQKKFQKSIAVFITIAGLAGGATLIDDSFLGRMKTLSNTEVQEDKETGSTRVEFWKAAWEMAKDYPLGAGYGGFNHYAPIYIPEDVNTGGRGRHRTVHSTWFEALTEIGYLGLFSFIMMIYVSFRSFSLCKKNLKESNQIDLYFRIIALEAALLGFLITVTFINRMRAEILYWLILYSSVAYNLHVLRAKELLIKDEQEKGDKSSV